jgi:AhpD family alkylhydroperoxidase
MIHFPIPKYEDVSKENQQYFDFFKNQSGSLPNLYAMLAHSGTALNAYWKFHQHPQSLSIIEKEITGIVVASYNESAYCLETHVMIAKLNGLTDDQISEIIDGTALFNNRYDGLVRVVHAIVRSKGRPEESLLSRFFEAGYTTENLVDLFLCIADNTLTNLLTCSLKVPSDNLSTNN